MHLSLVSLPPPSHLSPFPDACLPRPPMAQWPSSDSARRGAARLQGRARAPLGEAHGAPWPRSGGTRGRPVARWVPWPSAAAPWTSSTTLHGRAWRRSMAKHERSKALHEVKTKAQIRMVRIRPVALDSEIEQAPAKSSRWRLPVRAVEEQLQMSLGPLAGICSLGQR
ncbi:hypothetical protein C2845_PM03G31590 [Panicum miliaceum]|uniref:Uncharacterized protein n=1 Tax=Panicum miliaceum TaxID=4540 RepID=A0A3L6TCG6_PANMI|nr:hypothetical protein C2845_PM03G31590 [Panicum miliaceum]